MPGPPPAPTDPDPVLARRANAEGMAAMQRGDFAAAHSAFGLATQVDPKAGALWRNLAHACREGGDLAGEREALDKALSLNRRDITALLRSAELYEKVNDEAQALASWSGVLQLASGAAPPDGLKEALEHGRAFVEERQARLAARVDADLGATVAAMGDAARRRMQAFIDGAVGRRRFFVNECAGLFYPFLPADEFFDDHHFGWFPALEAKAPAIRRELEALLAQKEDGLRPYVRFDEGTPESKWSPLDGSLDWGAIFLWEYGRPNSAVLDQCPVTAEALAGVPLAQIPGRAPSAFFSLLRPNTRIPPHSGVSNTRAIVHLALSVPEGCGFRVGGSTREWREGKAFAFDDTIEHEAWNSSDELRAVLIFDVWNPHLSESEREGIASYYASADSSGLNPERAERGL